MKVLAIDPGYGRCGVAIVEKKDGKERWIYSECIETSAKTPFADRLAHVVGECERLIKTHNPDSLALERLFFNSNQKTAMQVAEVRGALLQLANTHNLPSHEYTPSQIKSATTGYGKADKKQVTNMLHMLLGIEKKIRYDDEYDAIAVGLTHLAHLR